MSEHTAKINWERGSAKFSDKRYSRSHQWTFDGGMSIPASASAHFVPVPMSDPSVVDPEEAFVAGISSCHMLWFLSIAAANGFVVDTYSDHVQGIMGRDENGKTSITLVTLNPETVYSGNVVPTVDDDARMHQKAHEACFLANSVRSEIRIKSVLRIADQT